MSQDSPTAGRRVAARYVLREAIGRGGMGTVWLAHDEVLDRVVAIKEVRYPDAVTDEQRELLGRRTLQEARAAAQLSSPHVTAVHDVVDDGGGPWIVMEYVPSRTLAQVVQDTGPMPVVDVIGIGIDLLAALEAAHRADVVHRDVKPGNVLLDRAGRAWLTDFGIATSAGDPRLTQEGILVGSPQFMAPERARGGKAGPFADLFSLGATLYAALEGCGPFDRRDAMATLVALTTDPPAPPRRAGPLTPVLLGLLEKDPDERITGWQARAALLDLSRQLGRRPAASTPPPSTPPPSTPPPPSWQPPSPMPPGAAPVPPGAAPVPPGAAPGRLPPKDPPASTTPPDPGRPLDDMLARIDHDELSRLATLAGRSLAKGAAEAALKGAAKGAVAWQEHQQRQEERRGRGGRPSRGVPGTAATWPAPPPSAGAPERRPSRSDDGGGAPERRPHRALGRRLRRPLIFLGVLVGGLLLVIVGIVYVLLTSLP